jgi:O-antigen biosynthesis protein
VVKATLSFFWQAASPNARPMWVLPVPDGPSAMQFCRASATGAGVTIGSGATLTGKGTAGALILSGGTITQTGGPLTLTSVTGKGTVNGAPSVGTFTASNGTLDLTGTISGAILAIATFFPSDLKIDGIATSTAAISLTSSANQTLEVGAAGVLTINKTETVAVGKILMSGGTLGDSAGIVLGTLATSGTLIGFGTVSAGITTGAFSAANLVEAAGGRLILGAGIGVNSGLAYEIAGTAASVLQLGAAPATGNTFTFLGAAGDLELSHAATFNDGIVGLNVGTNATPTNFIDILNVPGVTVISGGTGSGAVGTVTMSDGAAFQLSGVTGPANWFVKTTTDGAGGTDIFLSTACYLVGTQVLSDRGQVAVEDLVIGDHLITVSGAAKPIRWIGRRNYSGRFAVGNRTVLPIVIRAGALADGVPRRDLLVSPKHAMFLDGMLIPAEHLINGVSVAQIEAIEEIAYLHIELDQHEVIHAEGALSETYVDDENRGMFHNAHEFYALHPDVVPPPARYFAERVEDGYELEVVRRRIEVRAGLSQQDDPATSAAFRGSLDHADLNVICGWAQNSDHPEAPVCLDIFDNGVLMARTLANRYRADLKMAALGSGRHGFEVRSPTGLCPLSRHIIQVIRSSDGSLLGSACVVVPLESGDAAAAKIAA